MKLIKPNRGKIVTSKKILKNKEKYEGKVFKTLNYGGLLVLEYRKSSEVLAEFVETKTKITASIGSIMAGQVKDRFAPSVCGVGIIGNEITVKNGKAVRVYNLWQTMLERCYGANNQDKLQAYKGCTVSENFKYFPYFKEWCSNQIGFGKMGWDLDKDLLSKGNKIYSEDTCCFIPSEINRCISSKGVDSKYDLPLGVKEHGGRGTKYYSASISKFGENYYIGNYDTIAEAETAYKVERKKYICQLACKWKDSIDPRAYDALIKF